MSPSYRHESVKSLLGHLVVAVCREYRLPFYQAASTTFRRRGRRLGAEADESFYIANVDRIRGKATIDLLDDPPPDLVIEVVHSRGGRDAVQVWKRFGVSEIWACGHDSLRFLVRKSNGRYENVRVSSALPPLTPEEAFGWTTIKNDETDLEWHDSVQRWVRGTILPRREQEKTS